MNRIVSSHAGVSGLPHARAAATGLRQTVRDDRDRCCGSWSFSLTAAIRSSLTSFSHTGDFR